MGKGLGSSEDLLEISHCGLQYTCAWKQCSESLSSHLYLKQAKLLCLSYYLCFLFNKIGEAQGGDITQTMYAHVNK
jgi:hypothetical protein